MSAKGMGRARRGIPGAIRAELGSPWVGVDDRMDWGVSSTRSRKIARVGGMGWDEVMVVFSAGAMSSSVTTDGSNGSIPQLLKAPEMMVAVSALSLAKE